MLGYKNVGQLICIKAEFRFFTGNMHLEKTINNPVNLLSLFIDFQQQFQAVYAMNQTYKPSHIFYLVCLNVANHMPFNILWHLLVLFRHFLDFVFTENTLPGIISFK